MNDIAIMLRTLQLCAHNAHNLAKGVTFMQDHAHFGELYSAYESEYDDVVERMIGLGTTPDLGAISKMAAMLSSSMDNSSSDSSFKTILEADIKLTGAVEAASDSASLGTQDLMQKIANACEIRQYKMKQRLAV